MATDAAKTEPPPAAAATTALQAASPSDEPPGLMAAKTEGTQPSQQVKPSAPYIIDSTLLGLDSKVEKFSDGKIYVTTAGNTEEISEMLYQTLLHQNMKRVASSSIPTGLASHIDDSEPIEWGDMDPAFARLLQSTPALLSACKTLRSPKKMAKLDIATVSFQPSTNVALPEPSPAVTLPDSVTLDNIKDTIRSYHDTTVQPSLDLLNKHIRQEVTSRLARNELNNFLGTQTLNAIESEQQRRSVIIYNISLFSNMASISQNMNYLLKQADLSNADVQSVSNHLHTSSSAFLRVIFLQENSSKTFLQAFKQKRRYWHSETQDDAQLRIEKDLPLQERLDRVPLMTIIEVLNKTPDTEFSKNPYFETYLKPELNALQLYDQDNAVLLAQVVYLSSKHLQYQCQLLLHPSIYTLVVEHFPKMFGDKMKSFLLFVQGYTQSSRHSTTSLRYHYGQSKDISNIPLPEAVKYFPYDIYPIELDSTLSAQLSENPAFLVQGFSGIQPLIQQAMQDFNMSYADFGHKGKGRKEAPEKNKDSQGQPWPKGKNKSKGKGNKGSKSKGKGEIFDRLNQEGKGNKDFRSKPYSNQWHSKVEDYSQRSRPSAWYSQQDYDNWGSDNTWTTPGHSSGSTGQGKGHHSKKRNLEADNTTNIFPCNSCMALAGTNSSCKVCTHEHWQHFEHLRKSFRSISKYHQPKLESFPCPIMLSNGDNCKGSEDIFGTGDCLGCVLYRDYIFKVHTLNHPPLCPYNNVLYLGYERAMIATLEDSSFELLDALQEASYSDLYNNAHEDLQIWWDRLVNPLEPDDDPLFELPKWTDQINYKAPNKTYFMMQTPFFTQLGNSISSCNIQSCSHFLSLMEEALTPVAQNAVDEYSLPSPSSVANLDLTIKDLTALVWLPWDHMVRTSYSLALEHYQIPLVWDIPSIDSLLNKFLPGMEQPYLQQFVDNLVEIVHKHPVTIDIFGGLPPFTNAPLKKLASAGSYFFDQVYAQLASLLQVQTTTKQNLVAPNDAFTEIYDLFMYSISPDSPLYQHSDQYRNRHWNNKGNSLEALSLILADYGYHSLVWIMAWICIQLSYKDKSYSFVNPYVTC